MPLYDPAQFANNLRALRLLWTVIGVSVAGLTVVFAVLTLLDVMGAEPMMAPDGPFYLAAFASMGTIVAAFLVQRRLADAVLPATPTFEAASAAIRTHGILSLALMEGGALLAGVAALVSHSLVPLAFVVPFFAFWAFFYPSESRYLLLLSRTPMGRGKPGE